MYIGVWMYICSGAAQKLHHFVGQKQFLKIFQEGFCIFN